MSLKWQVFCDNLGSWLALPELIKEAKIGLPGTKIQSERGRRDRYFVRNEKDTVPVGCRYYEHSFVVIWYRMLGHRANQPNPWAISCPNQELVQKASLSNQTAA